MSEEQSKKEKEIQDTIAIIHSIIEDCKDAERRVEGFGYQMLDQIATEHNMPDDLKSKIKLCIDDPTKEFTITAHEKKTV